MTPQELESIGLALYGPRWRSRLAEALGRDRSTVTKWANGTNPVTRAAAKRIRKLAEEG